MLEAMIREYMRMEMAKGKCNKDQSIMIGAAFCAGLMLGRNLFDDERRENIFGADAGQEFAAAELRQQIDNMDVKKVILQ